MRQPAAAPGASSPGRPGVPSGPGSPRAAAGAERAVGFDMGGTSCDVCAIADGAVGRGAGQEIAGRPLHLPMIDVHTVGAGGGSIGWRDAGGALRVGPRSAGAEPGPACYGKGGTEPAVTDANLALGYLADGAELAGVSLDGDAARRALERLGEQLGLGPVETAAGIVRIANREMVGALRVVTVERGLDPRRHALLSFGGAGGLHAAAIAAELGIGRVLCPLAAGVLSAFGLTAGERRRDLAATLMLDESALADGRAAAAVAELAERVSAELAAPTAGPVEAVYEVRYEGQAFELDVPAGPGDEEAGPWVRERFEAAHERRYGYRDPDAAVELVGVRVAARGERPRVEPPTASGAAPHRTARKAWFPDRGFMETTVLGGPPAAGEELPGPAVIELRETTLLVPPGASARAGSGSIEIALAGEDADGGATT